MRNLRRPWLAVALCLGGCSSPLGGSGGDARAPADSAGEVADLGGCAPACFGVTPYCNASRHCVGCVTSAQCGAGHTCKQVSDAQASCVVGCTDDKECGAGRSCCDAKCVDPATDASNCGACGKACSGVHARVACVAGACKFDGTCDPGFGDCNQNAADGCEANLHLDPNHCEACGTRCAIANAISACADGCYVTACNFGFDDCDGDPKNGCETSVLADGLNCGGCGVTCNALPNAKAGCANGACTLGSCSLGFFDCDGDAKDGCEAEISSDPKNCGKCGTVCPQNLPFCNNGVCGLQPPCKNPGGGGSVHDNGAGEKVNYCYDQNDTLEKRAQKACESHFGIGKCCVIPGGYNGQQYGQCGADGGQGTIHWHPDDHPMGHCDPNYVKGDVVSPGWCGMILGSFTK